MDVITTKQFDFQKFRNIPEQKRHRGNPGTKKKIRYKNIITAFDIETSRLKDIEQSVMYIWQWAFGPELVVVGRTWEEFLDFSLKLAACLEEYQKLIIFVHNLSFEFQFLRGIYNFDQGEVFCTDSRKILKCEMYEKLEFRCSYLHSNMSLDEYTAKMGAKHQKLVGDLDYTKERYPWTKLTDEELAYCINDVAGLVEAVTIEMKHEGDTIYSFPLTSTGYVRRDAKKVMRYVNHLWVKNQAPTLHLYEMLREAFRGGNTHANRFFSGELIEGFIHSVDRSSSYPDVLVNHKYPNGRFYEIGAVSKQKFDELYRKMHRGMIMRIRLYDVELAKPWCGCPYLSKDKCREIKRGVFDNGRVLQADYLETTVTDVDYSIIEKMYKFADIEYIDVAYTRYSYLPKPFTDLINEYYHRKTILKGVEEAELDYFRSKQKLNSLYGMCAQDPVKQSILFVSGDFVLDDKPIEDLLNVNNEHRQLPNYQIGVWCTAWARYELQRCIDIVESTEGARFLYTDTDSIKYTGDVDFSAYNDEKIRDSKEHGAYAVDPKGITHYMGVFEEEATAKLFKTLGAKKYAYVDMRDRLHITVAGVIKKAGAAELQKYGGIREFKPSFIFREAGGLEALYNDDPEVKEIEIEGHKLPITSNVVLRESSYTLGITDEYEALLAASNNYKLDLF